METNKRWLAANARFVHIKELLFPSSADDDDENASLDDMEAQFQTHMAKQSQRFLLGYIIIQLVYLVCFFIAATLHKLNYVPLVADCVMLILHIIVVGLHVYQRRFRRRIDRFSCPRIMLDITLLLDALLFAVSDPVVESQANRILHVALFFDVLGGIPSLDGPVLHHPYKSNSVFQFHVMYMSLFVLSFNSALIMTPLCMVTYSSIVLTCYRTYYSQSQQVQQVVWEDVFTDIVVMILTLFCTLMAKRMLEQLQRSFFQALQSEKKKALQEKVRRCKVEFENSNLQDMLTSSMAAGSQLRALKPTKLVSKFKRAPSVKSAPAAFASKYSACVTTRGNEETSTSSTAKVCQGDGDCLPAEALVWVENRMEPQPLHTLTTGMRILCYDNLLQCVKHREVIQATVVEEEVPKDYVTVELADGTVLEMTSDHHVECYTAETGGVRECKPALHLREGQDSIMVLNIMPQEVRRMVKTTRAGEDVHRRWVSVNVEQPQRNLVFVAQNGQTPGRHPRTMAVGSADLQPTLAYVKRTFLEVPDSEQASSRKTNSAPPTYTQGLNVSSPALSLQISASASLETGPVAVSGVPHDCRHDTVGPLVSENIECFCRHDLDGASELFPDINSDAMSSQSSALPDAEVKGGSSWRRRQRQRERRRHGNLHSRQLAEAELPLGEDQRDLEMV